MEKIFDKLLVEFLIPACLMLLCLLLLADVLFGDSFDLANPDHRKRLTDEGYLLIPALLFAYLLNTSATAVFYLWLRKTKWGSVREYLLLRKLNVFKTGPLKGINCWNYLRLTDAQREELKTVLRPGADNLYSDFMERMEAEAISAKSVKELFIGD